jgi:serine protease
MLRRLVGIYSILCWMLIAGPSPSLAQAESIHPAFVPGEVIVHWKNKPNSDTRSTFSTKAGEAIRPNLTQLIGRKVKNVQNIGTLFSVVRLFEATEQSTLETIQTLKKQDGVELAEPNYIRQAYDTNDKLYPMQWGFEQIKLPKAWAYTKGDPNLVIAVVDTGILQSHPDLKDHLVTGYDFVSDIKNAGDGDGRDGDPTDQGNASSGTFHGTHVAGIIGAIHNREGVAGVLADCKILPVRALGINKNGVGNDIDLAAAIRWAAGEDVPGTLRNRHPAKVINLSFGDPGPSVILKKAVQAAQARGAIVVAAAGNNSSLVINSEEPKEDIYPAAIPGVIVVGATGPNKKRASYSNFGDRVDIMAPGGKASGTVEGTDIPASIISTGYDMQKGLFTYVPSQGTSQAAPVVSGIIGLMLTVNKYLRTQNVLEILKATAFPLTTCEEGCGAGLINAEAAVTVASGENPTRESMDTTDLFTVHGSACSYVIPLASPDDIALPALIIAGIGLILLTRKYRPFLTPIARRLSSRF